MYLENFIQSLRIRLNRRRPERRARRTGKQDIWSHKTESEAKALQNQLSVFNYNSKLVRTVIKNGEPWFLAKDICDILEIGNPSQAISRLDLDEKDTIILNEGIGNPEKSIVSESGMYALVLGSRKQEAENFKRWVRKEVLPSIRKHGAYMTPETIEKVLLDPDTIINIATQLKQERQLRQQAEHQIEEQKQKVLFADAVSASKTSILVGELAKILKQNGIDIGQNRLFEWLRKNNYLISRKGTDYNMPTQYSMELGLFEVKETTITHSDGHISVSKTPKITGKGQQYFVSKFLNAAR